MKKKFIIDKNACLSMKKKFIIDKNVCLSMKKKSVSDNWERCQVYPTIMGLR